MSFLSELLLKNKKFKKYYDLGQTLEPLSLDSHYLQINPACCGVVELTGIYAFCNSDNKIGSLCRFIHDKLSDTSWNGLGKKGVILFWAPIGAPLYENTRKFLLEIGFKRGLVVPNPMHAHDIELLYFTGDLYGTKDFLEQPSKKLKKEVKKTVGGFRAAGNVFI